MSERERRIDRALWGALGYRVEQRGYFWVLINPDGSYGWACSDTGGWATEESAWAQLPPASGSWEGLELVVAAMQARPEGFHFSLTWMPSRGMRGNIETHEWKPCPLWVASFANQSMAAVTERGTTQYWKLRAEADTAAEAAALAALAALGVAVPE